MAFTNLEELHFKFNTINEFNGSLRILPNLTKLDLSYNKLESLMIDDVLSNISVLDLSYNAIKEFEYNINYFIGKKIFKAIQHRFKSNFKNKFRIILGT